MDFRRTHFEPQNLSDYEKSFEEIWVQDERVYNAPEDGEHKGKIISMCEPETVETIATVGYSGTKNIKKELEDLIDLPSRVTHMCRESQTRTKPLSSDFPIYIGVSELSMNLLKFDPVNRIFIVTNIYDEINDFAEKTFEAMKETERLWEKIKIDESDEVYRKHLESDKKHMVMDGDVFEVQKVGNDFFEFDSEKRKYDEALGKITNEKRNNDEKVEVDHRTIIKLAKNGITVKPVNERKVAFYKQIPLVVDRVIYGDQTPTKLHESRVVEIEDNIMCITANKRNPSSDTLFPCVFSQFQLNNKHPHRDGSTTGLEERAFTHICTGTRGDGADTSNIETVEQLVKRFEEISRGLRTVNLSSPLNNEAQVGDRYNTYDYARFYAIENNTSLSHEKRRHLRENYNVDTDEILHRVREGEVETREDLEVNESEEEGDNDGE